MKQPLIVMFCVLLAVTVISCTTKSSSTESSNTEAGAEWAEMDSFHMIMAEAFHPYKDSANVGPARQLAEQMATEAAKWQASVLPEKVNNERVKGLLEKLKTDTRAFADEVSTGITDEQIGKSLTSLHDNFHSLMEEWHGEGKH